MARRKRRLSQLLEEELDEQTGALGPYGMSNADLGWNEEGEDADEDADYEY